jgi:hypothetical protein
VQASNQFDGLPRESTLLVGEYRMKTLTCLLIPRPCVNKCLFLRSIFTAQLVINLVVVALGIEGRVNVAKMNRLIPHLIAQYVEIVSVVELIVHVEWNQTAL